MASRAVPWSAFPKRDQPADSPIRVLSHPDTAALRALVDRDPVANVFMAAQLDQHASAVPSVLGAQTVGYFADDGELLAACWVGANVIPLGVTERLAPTFGDYLSRLGRRHASIYGPAEAVLNIFRRLSELGFRAAEIRECQPLMAMAGESSLDPAPGLQPSLMDSFDQILPAAVAMFEEEVGYSPYLGGEEFYRRRVANLIRQGHSLSHLDQRGEVIFKADLGAVSRQASQVQGVWLRPDQRGLGLSAGYMAAVVRLARQLAPVVSLYVNDYNTKALASYQRVGFERIGTFATVLF
ncbi:DUF4081 domain-containing GNAT family N-acetyltransferase [Psychromicrobium silvestre]|uniref:GNAT family N-acetyltransferase n=1 Tax=Psychromicrobium silvestre TaxID=1645614 RepID=UPI0015C7E06B